MPAHHYHSKQQRTGQRAADTAARLPAPIAVRGVRTRRVLGAYRPVDHQGERRLAIQRRKMLGTLAALAAAVHA